MMKMNYGKYRMHPRMIELRFTLIHNIFVREYGIERVATLFKTYSDLARTNWNIISAVIGRKENIMKLSWSNRLRYRQEIVFMGMVFGEGRIYTGERYIGISKRLLYEAYDGMLKPEKFLNDEWLGELDYSVAVAGVEAYKIELERFLNYLAVMGEVLTGVSMAKI